MIATPLGPSPAAIALRDVARADRLDELGFELPLAGGDAPAGWVTVDRIADVLREFCHPRDPLRGYAERLQDPFLRRSVRGYLTGWLDLVRAGSRRRGKSPVTRSLDYKTNWLGEPGEPLTAFHYRPQALLAEMHRHHYALQALLYIVALHRFLRWRVPGYDPDAPARRRRLPVRARDDGRRGGPGRRVPRRVRLAPAAGLVAALSDVLDGGVRGA